MCRYEHLCEEMLRERDRETESVCLRGKRERERERGERLGGVA